MLQEQQAQELRVIEVYKNKIRFLFECLWPDQALEVFVIVDRNRMIYQTQIWLYKEGGPLVFQWRAEIHATGIFGPVPREVIAQINMVTA